MSKYARAGVGLCLVLILVLQLTQALDQCKKGCNGASGSLKLTPGTTYKYNYDGKISIKISSAEGQDTSTQVSATVLLSQQNDCTQVLQLQNVMIIGPDGKKRPGSPDMKKPIVLNSNNGELSDFICSEPGDSQNSLNIKRSIASFFQVNPEKTTEIDVFGQCPTEVSKSQEGDFTTLTKIKNLNKCAFRESLTNSYLTSTLNIHSHIHSSPILNADYHSTQKLKAGVLDTASIVENYLFVPFSVGTKGAEASIESKLSFVATSNDSPATKCQVPKSIIFDNPHPVNAAKSNLNNLMKNLKELSKNVGKVVEDKTALEFIKLVKLLRVSKKVDVLSVYNQVRSGAGFADKEAVKKIFLDAILASGNGDTIEVAIELLKNKELSPLEEKHLYAGLARAKHVTENSIKTATDLLSRANLPREAYLAVGSLAGRYCDHHNCEKVDVINKIIQKLLSKLGDLKAANRKEESDMIYVLKGLTNIGYLNDAILSKLVSLAEDKKQPTRLRVATLESYLAAPCKDKLRDSALKTLKDIQQDTEIRIKAYLVLAACPNDKTAKAIKVLLDTEKSNQVGVFIGSHIRHLKTSANPDKLLAKSQLGHIHTPTRFVFDPTKYSFNTEFSQSIDSLGLGNSVEGNIIYSQNSWIPRSASLNLTAELFGQRLNFLEISARQENLDKVIEHYLGPEGVIRKATLQQNWDQVAKPIENLLKSLKEKVDKSLRARRDVSQADIDTINKKIQLKVNELDKNLDLDFSIKNFGSEIMFMNSFDITEKLSPQKVIDNLVGKLNEGLNKLKSFEHTLRSNLLFLDAELSYPTSLGFPLRLGIEGASNIQIKAEGNIDVREIMAGKEHDLKFKLTLMPSAAITVAGSFRLDTPVIQTGLRVASTLHTSSGADLIVKTFDSGLGLDVKLNFPVQKQELIGFKHDIIFETNENGFETNNKRLRFSQNKDFSLCVDHLMSYIGLQFCADINGPNLSGKKVPLLPFPLSGDAKVSLRIERGNIDTFHYRRKIIKINNRIGVEADFETLGKNNEKGITLHAEGFLSPEKYIKATLNSPIKNAEAEARLVSNHHEKLLAFTLKDEDRIYSAKAGLKIAGEHDKTVYHPVLEYTTPASKGPQIPPFHVEGKVVAEKQGNDEKYTLKDVTLIIPKKPSIKINGHFGTEAGSHYTDLTVTDGKKSATVKGRLLLEANLLKIHAQLENSLNPSLNFNLHGEFKKSKNPEHISSNVQFTHGSDVNSKTNMITLVNSVTIKDLKNTKQIEFSTKNKLTYPLMKLDAKFDYDNTPSSVDYDALFNHGDLKVSSELKSKLHPKSVEYEFSFEAHGKKNKVEIKSSKQDVGQDDSKINNLVAVNGKKVEVSGKVKHHLKPNDVNVNADLVIKIPHRKIQLKLNNGVKLNPRELDFHAKLISGKTAIVDALLKANRVKDINGHLKVNIENVLNVNGQIKAQKGKGNANLLIDAKTVKKTAKVESDFVMQHPIHNLDITIYPLFNVDKNQKVALSTKNTMKESGLNSASTLDLMGSKYELNFNSDIGSPSNGKTSVDADLTLPDNQFLSGKWTRDVSTKEGSWNADNAIFIEHRPDKTKPGRKANLKVVVTDTNIKLGIVDVSVNVDADDSAGSKAGVDFSFKRQKNGDKWNVAVENKITSSSLDSPIEITFNNLYAHRSGDFNFKTSVNPKAIVSVQGKYDIANNQGENSGEVALDLTLPYEILSSAKFTDSLAFKLPQYNSTAFLHHSCSLLTTSSNPNMNIDYSSNLKIEGNKRIGSIAFLEEIKKPIVVAVDVSGDYNLDNVKKTGTIKNHIKVTLPENKCIEASGVLTRIAPKEYNIEATLNLPTEKFKSNKLSVHTKRTENNEITSQADLITDGQKYSLNSDVKLNNQEQSVDFKLSCPDGKMSELSANIKRPSQDSISTNLKVMCQKTDFLLEGGLELHSESLNNFYFQGSANCPKLNVKDILVKVGNKEHNDGKTLSVLVTSAGQNVISGSAAVTAHEEQGKLIVEGTGNFVVQNQPKEGKFKFIKSELKSDKHGETGSEISIDGNLGIRTIKAHVKMTNHHHISSYSYCDEDKKCAHVEVNAKSVGDISTYNNEMKVNVDLRSLGVPNQLGFSAVSHRQNVLFDHTIDINLGPSSSYQYRSYVQDSSVGISLTLPQRIIALEGTTSKPQWNARNGGKASGEIAFYLDKKNQPNVKTCLTGSIDMDIPNGLSDAEVSLSVAGINKPFIVKYVKHAPQVGVTGVIKVGTEKLILDVFDTPDKKIVASHSVSAVFSRDSFKSGAEYVVSVSSPGFGFDADYNISYSLDPKELAAAYRHTLLLKFGANTYDTGYRFDGSTKSAFYLLETLNVPIWKVVTTIKDENNGFTWYNHISGISFPDYDSNWAFNNNTITINEWISDDQNHGLLHILAFRPGDLAEIRQYYKRPQDAEKGELWHIRIYLNEKSFLQPDLYVNRAYLYDFFKMELDSVDPVAGGYFIELGKYIVRMKADIENLAQKVVASIPNVDGAVQILQSELTKLGNELASDQSMPQVGQFLKSGIDNLNNCITNLKTSAGNMKEKLISLVKSAWDSAWRIGEDDVLPKVRDVARLILRITNNVIMGTTDVVAVIYAKIGEMFVTLKPYMDAVSSTLSKLAEDIVHFVQDVLSTLKAALTSQVKRVQEEMKNSPLVTGLRTQYNELTKNVMPSQEVLINSMKAFTGMVKEAVPLPGFRDFIDIVEQYLEKKIMQQPVDDSAEMRKIGKALIDILAKLVSVASSEFHAGSFQEMKVPFVNFDVLKRIPTTLGAIRFSPLDYIVSQDITPILKFFLRLFTSPRSFTMPTTMNGFVFDGVVRTFDGKFLNVPATSCSYLLARDAVNGNFSVVVTFENKKLAAVTLSDRSGSVTARHEKLVFNDGAADYPLVKGSLSAHRTTGDYHLHSSSGIDVKCSHRIFACDINVSGFYHGQLRGLLGNANHEEFDDSTLPSGKISTNPNEFASSYVVGGGCQSGPVTEITSTKSNPKCDKAFGWDSPMNLCYPFVDPRSAKTLCEQLSAQGNPDALHDSTMHYVYTCLISNVIVNVPDDAGWTCKNSNPVRHTGEHFKVSLPGKSADVVFLVNTNKKNEAFYNEFIKPLFSEILNAYKAKGITDVNFYAVVYGGENRIPSHVTVDGKPAFTTSTPNLIFSSDPAEQHLETGHSNLNKIVKFIREVIHDVKSFLGLNLETQAFVDVNEYPYRAEALRSVVMVPQEKCEHESTPYNQLLKYIPMLMNKKDIHLNVIAPVKDLKVKDGKTTKDIIGFNSENVFKLSEAQAKPDGNPALQKDLAFNSLCADYTLSIGGNVFVSDNFIANKNSKQQILSSVAHNIVGKSMSKKMTLDCSCRFSITQPLQPYNHCTTVEVQP